MTREWDLENDKVKKVQNICIIITLIYNHYNPDYVQILFTQGDYFSSRLLGALIWFPTKDNK